MGAIASQITSLTIVYSTVYSDQSKHQSSASLAFVRGIHRGPMNSPHKWPVTRKMFPFDDVIMTAMDVIIYCQWLKSMFSGRCLNTLSVISSIVFCIVTNRVKRMEGKWRYAIITQSNVYQVGRFKDFCDVTPNSAIYIYETCICFQLNLSFLATVDYIFYITHWLPTYTFKPYVSVLLPVATLFKSYMDSNQFMQHYQMQWVVVGNCRTVMANHQ